MADKVLQKLAPASPSQGPPLPRGAHVGWPWKGKRLRDGFQVVPEVRVPSPFGTFRLPSYGLPPLRKPRWTKERKEAMRHALGSDLSQVAALIPAVGDVVADVLEDVHMAEVKRLLPPDEFDKFLQETKVAPDTLALLRTYIAKG
ncbi:MAG: hypothetical protein WC551_08110 [Patescibacteria group bacterium]